jgi:FKBP-type peptidyl-prolyl cis-trans isomerase
MKKHIVLAVAALAGTTAFSQTLKTHRDSVSYALGVSMAETLKKSGITDYDQALFMDAVKASMNGKATMDATAADKLYREESKKAADAKAEITKKAGEEFLKANKDKQGVKTTASGLQYKTTSEGTGLSPDSDDKVTVHYHGTLIDGTVFDSSVERGQPATFGLNQVISGWTEGLQLMKEGGKTTFYIPSNLGYGARAQGKIAANSTLIFDVELIKVEKVDGKPAAGKPATQPTTQPATGKPASQPATQPATKDKK